MDSSVGQVWFSKEFVWACAVCLCSTATVVDRGLGHSCRRRLCVFLFGQYAIIGWTRNQVLCCVILSLETRTKSLIRLQTD